MRAAAQGDSRATIVVVGPSPDQLGGMAAVVGQTLRMDLGPRFCTQFVANTRSPGAGESWRGRVGRHLRQLIRLRRMIRSRGARLVHIHTCSGFSFYRNVVDMLAARSLGCPVVLHVHGAAFDEFHRGCSVVGRWLIGRGLAGAEAVIALSPLWQTKLRRLSPRAKVVVVENAVELPASSGLRRADGRCRFVLLAKMDRWKGVDDLLEACVLLSERDRERIEITLAGPAGTAGDSAILAAKIGERKLQQTVRYIGPVRGRQKATLLAEADAYVQPSHHEGMPIAVLEALSYGLPVVGTTVGSMPEIVGATETGTLVPPHAPAALSAALVSMATDERRRRALSVNARELAASRFGLSRLREDLVRLYERLLAVD